RARGYAPDIRHVDLAPGSHTRLTIVLIPLLTAPDATPLAAPPPPRMEAPRVEVPRDEGAPAAAHAPLGPIALGVVGLAGFGMGTYYGVRTLNAKSARDAACAGVSRCRPEALTDYNDARDAATVSSIAFGAGAALLAAGITW